MKLRKLLVAASAFLVLCPLAATAHDEEEGKGKLGKVAFDQRHDYAQAADWFAKCWQEQPQGGLAREAAGRRLEALRKAGSSAQATQAARDYLERYPTGPHAELARAQLK